MNKPFQDLSSVKLAVRSRLVDYLRMHGVQVPEHGNFSCFNPAHNDKDPSCGLVPRSNGTVFKCFGCEAVGDIFNAAYFIEGKQLSGAGFIATLRDLAEMFSIPMPEITLSPEQVREMDLYSACAAAARVISTSELPPRIKALIENHYKWNDHTRKTLQIGSVQSYEWFESLLVNQHGFTKESLREFGLDDRRIFAPNCLIYTVKDEFGNAVGFAARNLDYDVACAQRAHTESEIGPEAAKRIKVPPKYVNSMEETSGVDPQPRNTIYQKGRRLFGLNIAKKALQNSSLPLFVFEGYADAATAQNAGLTNCAAIGATAFTQDHINMVLGLGLHHIVFCLDGDSGGKKGTDRFLSLVDEILGGHIGLKVELVSMPEGSDDPDKMIREKGLNAFLALPKIDIFGWRLDRALEGKEDPEAIVNKMVRLIVNEPSNPRRWNMALALAAKTGFPVDVVWKEIEGIIDGEKRKIRELKSSLSQDYAKKLQRDPENPEAVIVELRKSLEMLDAQTSGYRPGRALKHVRSAIQTHKVTTELGGMKLGWPLFDERFGGIPTESAFISIPGKPNQGKSSLCTNIAWRLVDNNPRAICYVHTIDDTVEKWLPRLLGSRSGVPSEWFRFAGHYLDTKPEFVPVYQDAVNWLQQMMAEERLIIEDMTDVPQDILALDTVVRDLRGRFPEQPLVVIGDNFHQYDYPGSSQVQGEARQRNISHMAKGIAARNHCAVLMTMEIPKEDMAPGVRPRMGSIKGSSAMAFDIDANIGVYNDIKDYGASRCTLYWEDPNDKEPVAGPQGEVIQRSRRKPVIELVFDKSKVFRGYDGQIYFKLDPWSGRYEECSLSDQAHYEGLATQPKEYEDGGRGRGRRFQGSGRPAAGAGTPQAPEVSAEAIAGMRVPDDVTLDHPF